MKVILTKNVNKLGEVGDVCAVKPGYGRNFLLPQDMAILATSGALRQIDDLKRTEKRRQDKIRYEMMDFAKVIEAQRLEFTAKVGETGRLYGSVTASNIADALEEALGQSIDRRKIVLDESIRTLGEHAVPIHLMPGVDAKISVEVVASAELVQDIAIEESEEGDEGEEADALEASAQEQAADTADIATAEDSAEDESAEAEPPAAELEEA